MLIVQAEHYANKFENSSPVLGVAVGETRYLIPMSEVSEVIDMSKRSCCSSDAILVLGFN